MNLWNDAANGGQTWTKGNLVAISNVKADSFNDSLSLSTFDKLTVEVNPKSHPSGQRLLEWYKKNSAEINSNARDISARGEGGSNGTNYS